jgi:membrane-bound lytic murein transglycosylase D
MMRAVKANRSRGLPTDFWSLQVRTETSNYVPRLLALARMVKSPKKYGLKLKPIPEVQVLASATVNRAVNLREVASAARLDPTEFSNLNARYIRHVTLPNRVNRVLLPRNKEKEVKAALLSARTVNTDSFFENLRKDIRAVEKRIAPKKPTPKKVTHTVERGDTLSSIARKYGVSVASIRSANNLKDSTVRTGQKLTIENGKSPAAEKSRGAQKSATTYTVKQGDTLSGIASRFGVSSSQIMQDNSLKSSSVRIGQKLRISGGGSGSTSKSAAKASRKSRSYKVQPGETLYGIALKHNVSVSDIQKSNNMGSSTSLKIGQTLKIP